MIAVSVLNGAQGGIWTHKLTILSHLSLPFDYSGKWSFCRESSPLDLFIRQGRKYRFASRRMFEGAPDSPSPHFVEVLTGNKANSFLTAIGLGTDKFSLSRKL